MYYFSSNDIPDKVRLIIENSSVKPIYSGQSGAKVYSLTHILTQESYILKVITTDNVDISNELVYECSVLRQLEDYINVPELIYHSICDEHVLVLETKLSGNQIDLVIDNPKQMAELCGKELRTIHSLKIHTNNLSMYDKLALAKFRVDNGYVDETDFEDEFLGIPPSELYQKLLKDRPSSDDIVLTHGDFTFENILFSLKDGIGIIDWGRAGLCDRYQDISLFIRSIRHRYEENTQELIDIFIKSYGLKTIDNSKVNYYILLDEFF